MLMFTSGRVHAESARQPVTERVILAELSGWQ